MILAFLTASLPLIFWWRFKDTPLDRDYAPYAYPAVFKTGYLQEGHVDIKPPLIHWSYKIWLGILSPLNLNLKMSLRLLPSISACVTIFLICQSVGLKQGLVLAILLCSTTLWAHMANTEWLTVMLLSIALSFAKQSNPQLSLVILSLLPWVNQKNVLLIAPVAWALGLNQMPIIQAVFLMAAPSVVIMAYLALTGRWNTVRYWLIAVPANMGQKRTLAKNTMPALKLLTHGITLLAPVIAMMDLTSPWSVVAGVVVLTMILSKQIVPHHYVLLALPLALTATFTTSSFAALALIWLIRDGIIWFKPDMIYKMTFPNYAGLLSDSKSIEDWIIANTKEDEVIWVNGMENQIYLNTTRKAWRIEIPELDGIPEGEGPRVIVHCGTGSHKFDYEKLGYETEIMSNSGHYALVVKK